MLTLPAIKPPTLVRPQEALVELFKSLTPDLRDAFRRITEQGARVLDIDRVSIWLYDEPRAAIVCEDLYVRSRDKHEHGARLAAVDFPRYFAALEENRTVAARDACADPRTSEFAEGYLDVNGITSMLDAPIRSERTVIGVVCFEHIGPRRDWPIVEEDFAGSLADAVALVLERAARLRLEERCTQLQTRFRELFHANVAASFMVMRDGVIVDANAAFAELAGLGAPEEAMGRSIAEFFVDPHRTRLKMSDGRIVTVRSCSTPLAGEESVEIGTAVLG